MFKLLPFFSKVMFGLFFSRWNFIYIVETLPRKQNDWHSECFNFYLFFQKSCSDCFSQGETSSRLLKLCPASKTIDILNVSTFTFFFKSHVRTVFLKVKLHQDRWNLVPQAKRLIFWMFQLLPFFSKMKRHQNCWNLAPQVKRLIFWMFPQWSEFL